MTIGERIRLIREKSDDKKISMASFAEIIGVTSGAVSQWENGQKVPSASVIKLICNKFNVRENWLLKEEGEMFVNLSKKEQLEDFFRDVEDNDMKVRLIEALSKLTTDDWEHIIQMYNRITSNN
ncbi:MAG: helix-turn-helix transcriptional regulator [Lachnospiraceae bacterium]|nr:helix-turn-helix transcriptional regulator [Lachnospiraceae bacterium]